MSDFENPQKAIQKRLNTQETATSKYEVVRSYAEKFNDSEIIKCMEEVLKNSERIGLGKNAEVFDLPGYEELCVKKLLKNPEKVINPIDTEAEIQQEVFDMGIKTPMYYKKLRDNTSGQEYLVMQRIDGYSVGDILYAINEDRVMYDSHKEKIHSIAKNYNHEEFVSKIADMVQKIHERGLYHKDLHTGNIMIDKDANPVVIDWGAAGYESLSDEDEIYKADGRTWDGLNKKYVWGLMKTRNDREDLDELTKVMLNFRKFKEQNQL